MNIVLYYNIGALDVICNWSKKTSERFQIKCTSNKQNAGCLLWCLCAILKQNSSLAKLFQALVLKQLCPKLWKANIPLLLSFMYDLFIIASYCLNLLLPSAFVEYWRIVLGIYQYSHRWFENWTYMHMHAMNLKEYSLCKSLW